MTQAPDIIAGHKEIARFLGLTPRQVSWHDEQGELPTFRLGRTVCARKTKLMEWIVQQEGKQAERRRKRKG